MTGHRQKERYTLGYSSPTTAGYYARRSATRDAAFLLPNLKPGTELLDCGCGTGSITIGLATVVSPGSVVGIDIGEPYIERARADAAQAGVSNMSFEVGSVYELPFPDCSFDAVFSHAVLNYLADPAGALKEMHRVLKPGGVVGVSVNSPGEAIEEPFDPVMRRCSDLLDRLWAHNGGDRSVALRLRTLLREAGFEQVEALTSYECYGTSEGTRMWAERYAGVFTQPPVSDQLTELGWVSWADLEGIAAFWRSWAESPDAYMARTWREALGWKM